MRVKGNYVPIDSGQHARCRIGGHPAVGRQYQSSAGQSTHMRQIGLWTSLLFPNTRCGHVGVCSVDDYCIGVSRTARRGRIAN
jgi:hypothetical protein